MAWFFKFGWLFVQPGKLAFSEWVKECSNEDIGIRLLAELTFIPVLNGCKSAHMQNLRA